MLDDCCTSLQTTDTKLQICFTYIITRVLNFNNDYKNLKVFFRLLPFTFTGLTNRNITLKSGASRD